MKTDPAIVSCTMHLLNLFFVIDQMPLSVVWIVCVGFWGGGNTIEKPDGLRPKHFMLDKGKLESKFSNTFRRHKSMNP